MTYQIYALKYGERDTKESQFFFREASQKPLTLHFFIWVILGGPHPIVVDTGCTAPDAQAKELRAFVSPAARPARAAQLQRVVIAGYSMMAPSSCRLLEWTPRRNFG